MEWCWDSPRCLVPGTGCTESRATCSNPADCHCSDCNDSGACGGPGPKGLWTGEAEIYEYNPMKDCALDQRSPSTPVGHVIQIQRTAWDTQSMCTIESDITSPTPAPSLGLDATSFANIKYTCDGNSVIKTVCNGPGDTQMCSRCTGKQTRFAVQYNERGACLKGGGFGAGNGFQFEQPTKITEGMYNQVMIPCMVAPFAPFPPAPTPAGELKKDSVGLGVGLGLGIPAIAGGLWYTQKRRKAQQGSLPQNTELLAGQGGIAQEGGGSLGEMYSSL